MLSLLVGTALLSDPPLRGDRIAPFEMMEPGGKVYSWSPGRVGVICAFAYWCDTWKTQRERLAEARRRLVGTPVDFLGVSVDGQWLDVDKQADWSYRLIDSGSRWSKSLNIDRVPYTLVVDESGTVRWVSFGISRSDDIVRAVRDSFGSASPASNTVYLTFDDFPAKQYNSELLDALRQEDVHASFFVIGENASSDPRWVRRAFEDGNRLEVHGWEHTAKNSEPERCRDWLRDVVGIAPSWVRSPGSNVVQDFRGNVFKAADVDPYDFQRPGVGELKRRVFGSLKGGTILHLHAGVADTISALPDIIERGRKLGLTFEPLP